MAAFVFIGTFLAALGAGLIAGVFFAFSSFVMTALSRLPVPQGVAAMQAINVAVLNPLFLSVFVGTAIVSALLGIAALFQWGAPHMGWLFSGAVLYVVFCFGVTISFNVPRNDVLAALSPGGAEAAEIWPRYVWSWTVWNHVRTVAAFLASAAYILVLL